MERPAFYQPAVPTRFSAEAIAKLSPSDPTRTLVAIHQGVATVGQKIAEHAAAINADTTLSEEGRRQAREKVFGDEVGGAIAKADQPLRLASLRADEQSAKLQASAIKAATLSEPRALRICDYLLRLPETERNRIVLEGIMSSDTELMSSILSAPAIFRITTPALRDRARDALIAAHDPEKAAELTAFHALIAACRKSFESCARFGRDQLQLTPSPAKPVPTRGANAA